MLVILPVEEERKGLRSVNVAAHIDEPTQNLLDAVMKKYKLTSGTPLQADASGVFVFKVDVSLN